jgi:uncharacterized membrane protein YtjA (UPF0391 family)
LDESLTILRLAAVFFVIALIAALFGFGFATNFSLEGAKILFFVFLVVLSCLVDGSRRRACVG